jgi:hypothetical protein
MQQRLPKFKQVATALPNREITGRSLAIIALLERYRFLPTSLLTPLVGGDQRTTAHHLQLLYHRGLINRFAFSPNSEMVYFLDNPAALKLLATELELNPGSLDWTAVRYNRERAYAHRDDPGQRAFVLHELMISRFHALLELACRRSEGRVELAAFRQGAGLWQTLMAPKVSHDPHADTWTELSDEQRVPHRPDAFFTLRFPQQPEGSNRANFFYEADRKTTNTTRFIQKLRTHFHFIAKQRRHEEHYGVKRIRAVLVETLDTRWAETLRRAARHPIVCGNKPTPLFWFTSSSLFTSKIEVQSGKGARGVPAYLIRPEMVLDKIWASPVEDVLYSLAD